MAEKGVGSGFRIAVFTLFHKWPFWAILRCLFLILVDRARTSIARSIQDDLVRAVAEPVDGARTQDPVGKDWMRQQAIWNTRKTTSQY